MIRAGWTFLVLAGSLVAPGPRSGPRSAAAGTPAPAAPARVTPTSPSPAPKSPAGPALDTAQVRAAFLSGEPDEIRRVGRRAGARRLSRALSPAPTDRVLALAAAAAAPWAEDAPWLLAPLADQAGSPDRSLALAAARAAAHIAAALDRNAELDRDMPLDWVRSRLTEYRALASDTGRWPDLRVTALEVATDLSRSLGDQAGPDDAPYDLTSVLADPDPELRRAALELTASPLPAAQLHLVAGRVVAEQSALVALVAGQVACDGLAFGDPARPVLAALGRRGIARLQTLVVNPSLPRAARVGAAHCLAADGSRASKAALAHLGHLSP